jgi:hypothetical protein
LRSIQAIAPDPPGYSRRHGDLTDGNDMDKRLVLGPY